MIRLREVSKVYRAPGKPPVTVLDRVSAEFPTGHNVGVLGLNGAGKSTLIRLLAGSEPPDLGRIERDRSVSFPLGLASVFHPDLTGRENCAFVAEVYGEAAEEVLGYVEAFSDLGPALDKHASTYSSGMLSKLAFGLCLAIDFDIYLIDEVTEVGDERFREKALTAFRERALRSDIILVSHNVGTIRAYCDVGAVLEAGRLLFFENVEDAIRYYRDRV